MSFFEGMLSLLIGIIGGIFSSIIVSRVFMIVTTYSEQIARIQARIEVTYGLQGALWAAEKIFQDKEIALSSSYKKNLNEMLQKERVCYAEMIFDDLDSELHDIAVEYSDFIENISAEDLNKEKVKEALSQLDEMSKKFNIYKKNRNKNVVKLFLKDRTLHILFLLLIVIIVLTVVANIL